MKMSQFGPTPFTVKTRYTIRPCPDCPTCNGSGVYLVCGHGHISGVGEDVYSPCLCRLTSCKYINGWSRNVQ